MYAEVEPDLQVYSFQGLANSLASRRCPFHGLISSYYLATLLADPRRLAI